MLGHTTVDMTARYTHVALDAKIKAVQALPVLGDNRIQNNTFAEVICNLPAEKLPRLATLLDAYLPLSKKEENEIFDEIFKKYNAHATFFISGEITPEKAAVLKKLQDSGC